MLDVAIIGCGIVGGAAAYEMAKYQLSIAVFEQENDVACGTSRANSAILHAGYDPQPQTLMARLNVEGVQLAQTICEKLDVPYKRCGSLVLAFSQEDMHTLRELYDRGVQNGVPELKLLDAAEVSALEPQISDKVLGALHAPSAAIVSPWEYTLALAETAVKNGVQLHLSCGVESIKRIDGGYALYTPKGVFEARYLLNAAGVSAAAVHDMAAAHVFEIKPDRGEYYLLDKCEGTRVSHIVFQCPTKTGKGVLVAPTVHGNLIVGPSNHLQADGEDTATTSAGLGRIAELARKSIPQVNLRESIRNFAGVRAASNIDDFIIKMAEDAPNMLDLAGIKSPGLTAAPAIARMAAEILAQNGLELIEKPDFIDRRTRVRFAEKSESERAELIRQNPAYARVICRCETVTEGEILDTLRTPIPPRSVDGVKRRCAPGMGRCQGGFCGPRVIEILAREMGVSPLEILQDGAGTEILTGESKEGMRRV